LVGLLTAALGMARHIWVRRSQKRRDLSAHSEHEAEMAEEVESEVEL